MTNAEWIRSLSDRDLAELLSYIIHCPCCPQFEAGICDPEDGFCEWYMLQWLQKEKGDDSTCSMILN